MNMRVEEVAAWLTRCTEAGIYKGLLRMLITN